MQWSPDSGRLLATGGNDNQVGWAISYHARDRTFDGGECNHSNVIETVHL